MAELIPAIRAQIEWSDNDRGQITDTRVFDRDVPPDPHVRARLYSNSAGACGLGWMVDRDRLHTPEGVFAEMICDGFANSNALLQALHEFGLIDSAEWARTMAAALRLRIEAES